MANDQEEVDRLRVVKSKKAAPFTLNFANHPIRELTESMLRMAPKDACIDPFLIKERESLKGILADAHNKLKATNDRWLLRFP